MNCAYAEKKYSWKHTRNYEKSVISPALIFLTHLISVPIALNSDYQPLVWEARHCLRACLCLRGESGSFAFADCMQRLSGTCLEGQKGTEMSLEHKCCGQQPGSSLCPCCDAFGRAVPELYCLHTTIISSCVENPAGTSSLTINLWCAWRMLFFYFWKPLLWPAGRSPTNSVIHVCLSFLHCAIKRDRAA